MALFEHHMAVDSEGTMSKLWMDFVWTLSGKQMMGKCACRVSPSRSSMDVCRLLRGSDEKITY